MVRPRVVQGFKWIENEYVSEYLGSAFSKISLKSTAYNSQNPNTKLEKYRNIFGHLTLQCDRNWYQDWGHCGELPRSLVTLQWPKSRYQFLFYHNVRKHILNLCRFGCVYMQKIAYKLLQISTYGKHRPHRPLSQQLPYLRLGYHCDITVMSVTKSWQYASLKN